MAAIPFVVPFGRDGAADRAARAWVEEIGRRPAPAWDPSRRSTGTNLVIENLPGAGGLRGLERANALAAAKEPVLLLGTPTTHVLIPARRGVSPHPAFAPLASLGSTPNVLLVSPRLGVRTVGELVARAHAGKLVYASAGEGQTIHACTALFCKQAGIEMEHRPYDAGSATAYEDLAAGRVHAYFDNVLGAIDRIVRGEAVPLAVSSFSRSDLLPEVPTLVACGFVDHALDVWLAVFGANLGEETRRAIGNAEAAPAPDMERVIVDSKARWTRALAAMG